MRAEFSWPLSLRNLLLVLLIAALAQGQAIHFFGQTVNTASCKTTASKDGTCVTLAECVTTTDARQLKTCGSRDGVRIVCCPTEKDISAEIRIGQVIAPKISFECGRTGSRDLFGNFLSRRKRQFTESDLDKKFQVSVVGGTISKEKTWPWMALFGVPDGATGRIKWFCDGALINDFWILSAAHCMNIFNNVIVRLGEHDHSIRSKTTKDFGLSEVIVHPNYGVAGDYEDLALVKLKTKVVFTEYISPVCLPWGQEGGKSIVGRDVTLAGWGTTQFGGKASSVLREAEVTVFDPAICESSYSILISFNSEFPRGMTEENVICAGREGGGVDACQGDSGGPIVLRQDPFSKTASYSVVGIVSKGHGCGLEEFPGIYAPVVPALQWIKDNAF